MFIWYEDVLTRTFRMEIFLNGNEYDCDEGGLCIERLCEMSASSGPPTQKSKFGR